MNVGELRKALEGVPDGLNVVCYKETGPSAGFIPNAAGRITCTVTCGFLSEEFKREDYFEIARHV